MSDQQPCSEYFGTNPCLLPRGHAGPHGRPERTYTHAEMLLNQAATLREAADRINRSKSFGRHPNLGTRTVSGLIVQWLRTGIATDSAPIAPSPDQLALDRHDAELRKKWEAERG